MTLPVLSNSISLGPVSIHWYGLLVVVGIVTGYLICRYLLRVTRYPLPVTSKNFDSLFFWLVIWGFIGARLYHVFNEPAYYWNQPIEILKFWNGGLAIHGAILVGVFVIFYFSHKYLAGEKSEIRISKSEINSNFQNSKQKSVIPESRSGQALNLIQPACRTGRDPETKNKQKKNSFGFLFSFLDSCLRRNDVKRFFFISDILVIGLAVGQAIGRWGNYFNQELFGKPTNGFFKVFIDAAHRPVGFENVAYYHPTFFYESVLNFVLFVILYIVYRNYVIQDTHPVPMQHRDTPLIEGNIQKIPSNGGVAAKLTGWVSRTRYCGLTTSLYLLGYGLIRFFIDFVRIDPRPFFGGLYLSQWVSLGMIAVGIMVWYTYRDSNIRMHTNYTN